MALIEFAVLEVEGSVDGGGDFEFLKAVTVTVGAIVILVILVVEF